MNLKFAKRFKEKDFQGKFTAQILAAAADPSLISFAGGLPNPKSFPIQKMKEAAHKVLDGHGVQALQYSGTAGFLPLREYICNRYEKRMGLQFKPEDIIITNGSQQVLDMFSSVLIDEGDEILVESPSYLAALQTFHLYSPKIIPIKLNEDGIDCDMLEEVLKTHNPKFLYMIPNFQNPTGLTYSEEVRQRLADILRGTDILVFEDNPYGELRFTGKEGHSMRYYLGDQVCMMGTFSKIVAPGMRIGWIACTIPELREKFLDYKSTMDLHTNIFGQMVLSTFLEDNDLDAHVEITKEIYKDKAEKMMAAMDKYLPEGTKFTRPEGGMFIWVTLPEGIKAVDVQDKAIKHGVAVCAGDPFFEYDRGVNMMRLNYSNASDEDIEKGVKAIGEVIREMQK